ncbi:hypothetical protein GCM10010326_08060 [Streptomyces xanthochromogenes]|uniref:Uncharacterized protein n=1 Tax=Streptomyces xanthochromogenes TaxID=67384 RepID=A0ABQ2ZJ98_9ACTN|nr:hypothetical protein GCM10010326_08060 [Streptomyces xanthochromogenes]
MGESGANPELTRNGMDRPGGRGEPEDPHGSYVKEVEPRVWATTCCRSTDRPPHRKADVRAAPVGAPFPWEHPT